MTLDDDDDTCHQFSYHGESSWSSNVESDYSKKSSLFQMTDKRTVTSGQVSMT
jgi:hypothetical protein